MDVIVIGGGINGLVAGAYLARHKKKVLILERQSSVGGAAITAEIAPGFRAPSLSHAIGPIAPIVTRMLKLDRSKLHLITPDPVLTTLGRDNKTISFHRDAVLTALRALPKTARPMDALRTAVSVWGAVSDPAWPATPDQARALTAFSPSTHSS